MHRSQCNLTMHTATGSILCLKIPITIIVIVTSCMMVLLDHSHTFCLEISASNNYMGSDACKSCHKQEYENFKTYAKKSRSYLSIERLQKGLSADDLKKCYTCHTTGYGKPGGFVSLEKTPHLKNAGCEVCHGPGELHIKSKDPKTINRKLSTQVCAACHTSERVKAFRYKPLIHGGGH